MTQTMSFEEILRRYWLEDRTLFALIREETTVTLRFDLYHADDAERSEEGMEYILDVSVTRDRFRSLGGGEERLSGDFSADILKADIIDGELLLTADCRFYAPRGTDVVELVLIGGQAEVREYPPMQTA